MAQTPTGTKHFVATGFGTAKTVTDVTNAGEAVVTSTAHGFSNGDYVLMESGWGRLNARAFRIKSITTDTFVLERADTSHAEFFPPGNGVGSVRKISGWQQITRVLASNSSGGEPKNVTYTYQEDDTEYSINDGFSAINRTFELDADVIDDPCYATLQQFTDVQSRTVIRSVSRNGAIVLLPGSVALSEEVTYQDGQINRIRVAVSGSNRSIRYPAL